MCLIVVLKKELNDKNLNGKKPTLIQDDAFQVEKFDINFAISISLFTHLFQNHIVRCLSEVKKCMSKDSIYYATFFEAPSSFYLKPLEQFPGNVVTKYDGDHFHYSYEEICLVASLAGLRAIYIGEWNHPRNQKMVAFQI